MANEGFSEEERRNAAEQIVRKVLPSLREHDDNMAQRVVVKIADPETKETFYAFVAIDLQCSLTRAQNELAFYAECANFNIKGGAAVISKARQRAELAESALAEAKKMSEAFGRGEVAAYHEASVLREQLAEANRKLGEREWVRVEDDMPKFGVDVLTYTPPQEKWGHAEKRRVSRIIAYSGKRDFVWFDGDINKWITHWQPLPAPPEPSERIPTEGSSGK